MLVLACVIVNDLFVTVMYVVANAVAAFAVVGISPITLDDVQRKSATIVLVALAVSVTLAMAFTLPLIRLFTATVKRRNQYG